MTEFAETSDLVREDLYDTREPTTVVEEGSLQLDISGAGAHAIDTSEVQGSANRGLRAEHDAPLVVDDQVVAETAPPHLVVNDSGQGAPGGELPADAARESGTPDEAAGVAGSGSEPPVEPPVGPPPPGGPPLPEMPGEPEPVDPGLHAFDGQRPSAIERPVVARYHVMTIQEAMAQHSQFVDDVRVEGVPPIRDVELEVAAPDGSGRILLRAQEIAGVPATISVQGEGSRELFVYGIDDDGVLKRDIIDAEALATDIPESGQAPQQEINEAARDVAAAERPNIDMTHQYEDHPVSTAEMAHVLGLFRSAEPLTQPFSQLNEVAINRFKATREGLIPELEDAQAAGARFRRDITNHLLRKGIDPTQPGEDEVLVDGGEAGTLLVRVGMRPELPADQVNAMNEMWETGELDQLDQALYEPPPAEGHPLVPYVYVQMQQTLTQDMLVAIGEAMPAALPDDVVRGQTNIIMNYTVDSNNTFLCSRTALVVDHYDRPVMLRPLETALIDRAEQARVRNFVRNPRL